MGLVGLVLLVGGMVSSGVVSKTFIKSTKSGVQAQKTTSLEAAAAKVDVSGAVIKPGVYTLSSDARVEDAIKAAGGVTDFADPMYLSKTVNLAQKVADGMKIYIPNAGEAHSPSSGQAGQSGAPAVAGASAQSSSVNINTASLSELDQLPGVGQVGAQKIIDTRPYSGIEELITKKAVTKSVYEKIKDLVSIW